MPIARCRTEQTSNQIVRDDRAPAGQSEAASKPPPPPLPRTGTLKERESGRPPFFPSKPYHAPGLTIPAAQEQQGHSGDEQQPARPTASGRDLAAIVLRARRAGYRRWELVGVAVAGGLVAVAVGGTLVAVGVAVAGTLVRVAVAGGLAVGVAVAGGLVCVAVAAAGACRCRRRGGGALGVAVAAAGPVGVAGVAAGLIGVAVAAAVPLSVRSRQPTQHNTSRISHSGALLAACWAPGAVAFTCNVRANAIAIGYVAKRLGIVDHAKPNPLHPDGWQALARLKAIGRAEAWTRRPIAEDWAFQTPGSKIMSIGHCSPRPPRRFRKEINTVAFRPARVASPTVMVT
jgi:hypothetical protein